MDAAPETQEPQKPRRWWLRMLVASAALVAVLLGVVYLTPIVRLHYHAWQYRKGGDLVHLKAAARILRDRKAHIDTVRRLLGPESDPQLYVGWGVGGERLRYGEPTGPTGEMLMSNPILPCMVELRFNREKHLTAIYENVLVFSAPHGPLKLEWVEID